MRDESSKAEGDEKFGERERGNDAIKVGGRTKVASKLVRSRATIYLTHRADRERALEWFIL